MMIKLVAIIILVENTLRIEAAISRMQSRTCSTTIWCCIWTP